MISFEFREWLNGKVLQYLPKERQKQGDKILCRCPLCGDSKKNSFKKRGYYYLKTGTYHCFNCDASVTGMKLLEMLSGENYETLRREYLKMAFDGKHFGGRNSAYAFDKERKNCNFFNLKNVIKPEWKNDLSNDAKEYLSKRMVLVSPFLKENFYSYFDRKGREYILIPWKINGIECYFQLNDFKKNGTMKYIFPRNMDKLIYGLDNIDISFPYIFCFEGVYDSLFCKNSVAIGGKFLTELQRNILKKRFPQHRICLALDNDKAGLQAVSNFINKNRSSTEFGFFKWFCDGTKEKDINDFVLAKHNTELFKTSSAMESCVVDPVVMKMWLARKGIR